MTELEVKLVETLLDALMLDWQDNGNVSADLIRDACIEVVAGVLGKSFDEVLAMIEKQVENLQ